MRDQQKTKAELIRECEALRKRVAELERIQSFPEVRDRLEYILATAPATTYTCRVGGDWGATFMSESIRNQFGYEPQQFVDDSGFWLSHIHPEDKEPALKGLSGLFENDSYVHEYRFLHQDGSYRWVHDESRLIRDDQAKPIEVIGYWVDITKQKKAEKALEAHEEMIRGIFNATTESILLVDRQATVLAANETAAKRFGRSVDELVGLKRSDFVEQGLIPPAVLKSRVQQVKTVFDSGTATSFVDERNGIVFRTSFYPILDAQGKVMQVAIFAADITEQKQAEKALQASEQRYREVAESLKELVYRADPVTFEATYVNRAVEDIYGYSPEEWLRNASSWEKTIHPDDRERVIAEFEEGKKSQRSGSIEYRTIRKDGQVRWVEDHFTWKKDAQGGALSVYGVVDDITEQKEIEEALKESEARYRGLFRDAAEGILVADVETKQFYYANPAACEMLGYSEEELRKMGVPDIHPKEDLAHVISEFDTQARGEKTSAVNIRCLRKDGATICADINTASMLVDGKECNVGFFTNVTERRETKRALEASELRYRTLAENVDFAIALIDKDHNVLGVNNAACAMFGKSKEALVGGKCYREFEKRPAVCSHCPGEKAMVTRRRAEAISQGVRDDGTRFDIRIQVFPVFGDDGEATAFVEVVENIAEQEKIRKELDSFREQMVRADRLASLGTLSATFAHELTQPLTFVLLSVQGLLESPEVKECQTPLKIRLEETLKEISNAISVVDKFRTFARQSAKTVAKEVHLNTVATKVVDFLAKEAEHVRVSIVNRRLDDLPAIYLNEQDLEQLFFALLQNAVQAADGKRDRTITVSGRKKGGCVEVQFADDCGGIAKGNLDRIFEPFFSTKTDSQGTGLGLCVVEQIVSRAGGKVRVESASGKGTTFSVTLPIKPSHNTGV